MLAPQTPVTQKIGDIRFTTAQRIQAISAVEIMLRTVDGCSTDDETHQPDEDLVKDIVALLQPRQ